MDEYNFFYAQSVSKFQKLIEDFKNIYNDIITEEIRIHDIIQNNNAQIKDYEEMNIDNPSVHTIFKNEVPTKEMFENWKQTHINGLKEDNIAWNKMLSTGEGNELIMEAVNNMRNKYNELKEESTNYQEKLDEYKDKLTKKQTSLESSKTNLQDFNKDIYTIANTIKANYMNDPVTLHDEKSWHESESYQKYVNVLKQLDNHKLKDKDDDIYAIKDQLDDIDSSAKAMDSFLKLLNEGQEKYSIHYSDKFITDAENKLNKLKIYVQEIDITPNLEDTKIDNEIKPIMENKVVSDNEEIINNEVKPKVEEVDNTKDEEKDIVEEPVIEPKQQEDVVDEPINDIKDENESKDDIIDGTAEEVKDEAENDIQEDVSATEDIDPNSSNVNEDYQLDGDKLDMIEKYGYYSKDGLELETQKEEERNKEAKANRKAMRNQKINDVKDGIAERYNRIRNYLREHSKLVAAYQKQKAELESKDTVVKK